MLFYEYFRSLKIKMKILVWTLRYGEIIYFTRGIYEFFRERRRTSKSLFWGYKYIRIKSVLLA